MHLSLYDFECRQYVATLFAHIPTVVRLCVCVCVCCSCLRLIHLRKMAQQNIFHPSIWFFTFSCLIMVAKKRNFLRGGALNCMMSHWTSESEREKWRKRGKVIRHGWWINAYKLDSDKEPSLLATDYHLTKCMSCIYIFVSSKLIHIVCSTITHTHTHTRCCWVTVNAKRWRSLERKGWMIE